jgi:hypothetical protein
MNRKRMAASLALALASTAALAVSGDRWYGTNRDLAQPEPIIVMRDVPERPYVYTYPERDVVIERRVLTPEPILVDRTYPVVTREYAIAPPYDNVTLLNPQTGPHLGMGLFPTRGPNDFGG